MLLARKNQQIGRVFMLSFLVGCGGQNSGGDGQPAATSPTPAPATASANQTGTTN